VSTAPALVSILLAFVLIPAQAAEPPASDQAREQTEMQLQNARKQLDQAAVRVGELSMQLYGQSWFDTQSWLSGGPPLAVLGINVAGPATGGPDATGGVHIVSVSPAGPADIAGLKANDVIVSFGGKELRGEGQLSPQQQLVALIHDAKQDEPVAVEYRREGKVRKTRIAPKSLRMFLAEALDRGSRAEALDRGSRGLGLDELNRFNELNSAVGAHDLMGFGSAEMLNLSPGLGSYFGTEKGLLVVRAPQDERLKLQDGDVILDIDGRDPNGVSHMFRILSSYRAGETLKLHIMRHQKHVELPIVIP
jgi:C-terminal processing protease CtpA/Prc